MNPKYQKVCADIVRLEGKAADIEKQLEELRRKKTELENLEIISTVRAMVMDKEEIMTFLSSMKSGKAAKPENMIHTEVSENE